MQIGDPLRIIEVEPLQLPVGEPDPIPEPDPVYTPEPEPEREPVPVRR